MIDNLNQIRQKLYDICRGAIDIHACDLLDEYIFKADNKRKREILLELVPDAKEHAINNFIATARPDDTEFRTIQEQIMSVKDQGKRRKLIEEYHKEKNPDEYPQYTKWMRKEKYELLKLPYFPLNEKQKKLQKYYYADDPYPGLKIEYRIEEYDKLPLREKMAIKLMNSNHELTEEEAYDYADWIIPIKYAEARKEREEKVKEIIREKDNSQRVDDTIEKYYAAGEFFIQNINHLMVFMKMYHPEMSYDELRGMAYGLLYVSFIRYLSPQYDAMLEGTFLEIIREKKDFDKKQPWKLRLEPSWRPCALESPFSMIFDNLLKELMFCYDFAGGLLYAEDLYPDLHNKVLRDMVEKVFDKTGNLNYAMDDREHYKYLEQLLNELDKKPKIKEFKNSPENYWELKLHVDAFPDFKHGPVLKIDEHGYAQVNNSRRWICLEDNVIYTYDFGYGDFWLPAYEIKDGTLQLLQDRIQIVRYNRPIYYVM